MTQQRHLKFEKELRKLAREVNREGLPYPLRPEATMALAVAVRDKLLDAGEASRASNAGALVARVFDRTMRKMPEVANRGALACTAGCTYCCHNVVMATPPEIFHAAGALRTQHGQDFVADVAGRCDAIGQSPIRVGGAKSPCPLLNNNLCSVYTARPSVCRKHGSFDVGACIAAYEDRGGDVPIRRFDHEIFECGAVALITGMRLWNERQGSVYELSGALGIALRDPQAEEKWLAGEGVFKGVASQTQLPGIDEHAAFLWSRFAGD